MLRILEDTIKKYGTITDLKTIDDIYNYVIEECKSFYGSAHELDTDAKISVKKALQYLWIFSNPKDKKAVIDEWCEPRGEYFYMIDGDIYYITDYDVEHKQKSKW